jgi:hypothetical protein
MTVILAVAAMTSVSLGQFQWEWQKTAPWKKSGRVVFANGRFFALGTGPYLSSSADGISWDTVKVGPDVTAKSALTYGHAGYALACQTGDVWVSPDGAAWTKQHSLSGEAGSFLSAAYGNGLYVASGYSAGAKPMAWLLTSSDAATWTKRSLDSALCCFTAVIFAKAKFVAVGADSRVRGLTMASTDGLTWTDMTGESDRLRNELWSVAQGSDRFVALGQNGGCLVSNDGDSWTRGDTGLTDDFQSIAYGNGNFVGIGENRIFRSPDGISWNVQDFSSTRGVRYVAFGNNRFVALGASDSVLISKAPEVSAHRASGGSHARLTMEFSVRSGTLHVGLPSGIDGKSSVLACHDVSGKRAVAMRLSAGSTQVACDVGRLPAGRYVLSLTDGRASERITFLITR